MPSSSDKQIKLSKREMNKKIQKKVDDSKRKKKNNKSDDDDNDDEYITSDSEDEMDILEYRKFLGKMFPSKHMNKKIKAGNDLKKKIKHITEDEENDEEEREQKVNKKKRKKKSKKKKKK